VPHRNAGAGREYGGDHLHPCPRAVRAAATAARISSGVVLARDRELPQALEAVEGMPSAAETRGNRGALLNVIRGRAMILMFMGTWRPERNSNAPSRCSAQARRPTDWPPGAAGQDADVAMLALAAWVFWILGQVDEAVRK